MRRQVVARFITARPIQLDKPLIRKLVEEELIPSVVQWLRRRPPDEPIGAGHRIARANLRIQPVGNRGPLDIVIDVNSVRSPSREQAVVSGSAQNLPYDVMRDDDPAVQVVLNLNGSLTPTQYLSERLSPNSSSRKYLHYGLYSVLIHELTHVREMPFMHGTGYEQDEKTGRPTDRKTYINSPIEVRARMQQIVDEALIWAKRRLTRIQAGNSNHKLIEQVLKYSETWSRIQADLTAASRNKILGAVYDALNQHGLLFE